MTQEQKAQIRREAERGRKAAGGEVAVRCPLCAEGRKKKRLRTLSVNLEKGVYFCHHPTCATSGSLGDPIARVEYKKPRAAPPPVTSESVELWLRERGFQNEAVLSMVTIAESEGQPAVFWPYYLNGEIVNYKHRWIDKNRRFRLEPGCQLPFWNIDAIAEQVQIIRAENEKRAGKEPLKTAVIITEGEFDAMAFIEAAAANYAVVSLPNGASNIELVWEAYGAYFEEVDLIYLALDDDDAGRAAVDVFKRLIEPETLRVLTYPAGAKDANDLLRTLTQELRRDQIPKIFRGLLLAAQRPPLESVYTVGDDIGQDLTGELIDLWDRGYPMGAVTTSKDFNALMSFQPGELTLVVGARSSGKSAFILQLIQSLNAASNWKTAAYSAEDKPKVEFFKKLVSLELGKSVYKGREFGLKEDEVRAAAQKVNKYAFLLREKGLSTPTLDYILAGFDQLIDERGINLLVIDHWNRIAKDDLAIRRYEFFVSAALTKLQFFAESRKVHIILVVHPTKLQGTRPTLETAKGAVEFEQNTDNGIVIFREQDPSGPLGYSRQTNIEVSKTKNRDSTGPGGLLISEFDAGSGRYLPFWPGWDQYHKPRYTPYTSYGQKDDDDVPF